MDYSKEQLKPKEIYRPFKARPLQRDGEQALCHLYQPIIGSDAVAVYLSLLTDAEDVSQDEFLHMDALTALDMGIPRFVSARVRLEAIGLLRVYTKNDRELGRQFLYELLEPVTPTAFFQDSRYCQLLLQKVSQHKFNQLATRFAPKDLVLDGYRQVTKRFAEVFGGKTDSENWALNNAATLDIEKQTAAYQNFEDTGDLKVTLTDLDWTFMKDLAEKEHLEAIVFTDELRERLAFYHELYGYNEMELVQLLADTLLLENGSLTMKQLDRLAEMRMKEAPVVKQPSGSTDGDELIRRKNTFLAQGYTEADWQAIQAAETYPPLKYLQGLKKAKRSFVTKNEEWLLKDLVEKSPLPNSVINQLMSYVLVDQNKSDLNSRLVNTIATDWSEKQLKTPEDAITYVRQRKLELEEEKQKKETRKQENAKRFSSNRPQRTEKLEDWSKYQTKTDPKLQEELERRMKEFLKEEGDG